MHKTLLNKILNKITGFLQKSVDFIAQIVHKVERIRRLFVGILELVQD